MSNRADFPPELQNMEQSQYTGQFANLGPFQGAYNENNRQQQYANSLQADGRMNAQLPAGMSVVSGSLDDLPPGSADARYQALMSANVNYPWSVEDQNFFMKHQAAQARR